MNANHGKGMFFIVLSLSLALAVFLTSFAGSIPVAAGSPGEMKVAAFPEQFDLLPSKRPKLYFSSKS